MTFDEYTRTLEFLTTMGAPREARTNAAYLAGYRSTHSDGTPPAVAVTGPGEYLYDRLRNAFALGAQADAGVTR